MAIRVGPCRVVPAEKAHVTTYDPKTWRAVSQRWEPVGKTYATPVPAITLPTPVPHPIALPDVAPVEPRRLRVDWRRIGWVLGGIAVALGAAEALLGILARFGI